MRNSFHIDQIRKLWVLNLLIKNGSFKQTASLARVTPSAISQTLSSLEQSIGKPLVIRQKGRVRATPEALRMLEIVRPAFEIFDRLKTNLTSAVAPQITWLSLGAYESIAVDILPGLLQRLKEQMPHLRLNLRVSRSSHLVTMLRKGELCSALVAEMDQLNRFYCAEVTRDRLGFYVARDHAIAEMGWDAIKCFGYGTLAPSRDGMPRYFSKFINQLKESRPLLVSDSFEILRTAAAAGTLVSLLPHRVAMRNRDLVEIYPPKKLGFKHKGEHSILVLSTANCDRLEADFIAAEVRLLLSTQNLRNGQQLDRDFSIRN